LSVGDEKGGTPAQDDKLAKGAKLSKTKIKSKKKGGKVMRALKPGEDKELDEKEHGV